MFASWSETVRAHAKTSEAAIRYLPVIGYSSVVPIRRNNEPMLFPFRSLRHQRVHERRLFRAREQREPDLYRCTESLACPQPNSPEVQTAAGSSACTLRLLLELRPHVRIRQTFVHVRNPTCYCGTERALNGCLVRSAKTHLFPRRL